MKSDSSIPYLGKKPLEVKWEPMPGKIICKVVGESSTFGNRGLIFKPPTHQMPRTTAEVIAIYEPFLLDNANPDSETSAYVNVGDTIIFGMHSGVEIEYGEDKVIVLREQEILTRVKLADKAEISKLGVAGGPLDDVEG